MKKVNALFQFPFFVFLSTLMLIPGPPVEVFFPRFVITDLSRAVYAQEVQNSNSETDGQSEEIEESDDALSDNEEDINDSALDEDDEALDDEISMEDAVLDDDADSEDDPFGDDGDSENEDEEDEEFETRITLKDSIHHFSGYSVKESGGLKSGDDQEREAILENYYQFTVKIQTTPYTYYYLRLNASLRNAYKNEKDQIKESYELRVREGFYYRQYGRHRYQLGAKLLKHGKVDYKSPINVLAMDDQNALDILNLDEDKIPTFVMQYDLLGNNQSFTILVAPFRQKTNGTEYTIVQNESEADEADKPVEDDVVWRGHAGVQYQFSVGQLGTRLSLFNWFDKDNDIAWKDTKITTEETTGEEKESSTSNNNLEDTDQNYKEKDSTISFITLELDWTLGNYVWKTDFGYFFEKNFIHYEKKSNGSVDSYSVQLPHLAVATSLERKFESIFIMPTYTYWMIYDIPKNNHIILFENEEKPLSETHNIEKHQLALIIAFEFSDYANMSLSYSKSLPFVVEETNLSFNWNPDGGNHDLKLKVFENKSDKIAMTGKRIVTKKMFFNYVYKF